MKKQKLSSSRKKRIALERRRIRAMKWYVKGHTQTEVAAKFKVSDEAASRWVQAYEKYGLDGLKSKGQPGPESGLDETDKRKIRQAILKGPLAQGYDTDLWTLERLGKLIKKVAKVDYYKGHVWKVMVSLGFTCQKPETKAKERDEKAIKTWRLKTFPRLKKMGAETRI